LKGPGHKRGKSPRVNLEDRGGESRKLKKAPPANPRLKHKKGKRGGEKERDFGRLGIRRDKWPTKDKS